MFDGDSDVEKELMGTSLILIFFSGNSEIYMGSISNGCKFNLSVVSVVFCELSELLTIEL